MIRKLILLLLFPVAVFAQPAIPSLNSMAVHDEAGVLSGGAKAELEAILKAERDSTSNQIAVLIIPSLQGEPIEEYSIRVVEAWKLGQKKTDNGVLFVVAIQDKKIRIEVGEGQEGKLTDAISNRIIRNEISPRFRGNDYEGGIRAGVMSIIQAVQGQYVNTDPPKARRGRSPWFTLIVIVIIIILASRRRRGGGGGIGGYWAIGSILSGMGGGGGGGGGSSWSGGGGSFGGGGSSGSW